MEYLDKWIPYDLKFEEGSWRVLWLYVDDHRFCEPFFDETIQLLRIKRNSRFTSTSSLQTLIDVKPTRGVLPLTSIIFHISRCGSTLLSQALSVDAKYLVVSEARIFDQILRMDEMDGEIKRDLIAQLLLKTVRWYGQNTTGNYNRFFIKLDSWHIHLYSYLRKAYPEVPFYFLVRQPLPVVESHIRKRGMHTVPGLVSPNLLGININQQHLQDFNYYTEQVLLNYYKRNAAVLSEKNRLNYFFDYDSGVDNMLAHFYSKVLELAKIPASVISRLERHSKEINQQFSGDSKVGYKILSNELVIEYKKLLKAMSA